jgi:flagellar L-ring protein FlgH
MSTRLRGPFLILALLAAAPAGAQQAQGGFLATLYGDRRAHGVGDALHLIIVESSNATMSTNQTHQQTTDTSISQGLGKLSFIPQLGFGASSASSAKGSSSRGGDVTARMTVVVTAVMPNGNLQVKGERSVSVNHDNEIIQISGEVRARDVTPDNTVYSYNLANVKVDFKGSDPRKPSRKVGLLTRILNFIF